MQARITNPAVSVAGAMEALQALGDAVGKSGVPETIVHLVGMRASQINGCGVCIDGSWRFQRAAGETDERLLTMPRNARPGRCW
jgi:AhpD family alkylhydroperoxidase